MDQVTLEVLRTRTLAELLSRCPSPQLGSLSEYVRSADQLLNDILQEGLVDRLTTEAHLVPSIGATQLASLIDGRHYIWTLRESGSNHTVLEFDVLELPSAEDRAGSEVRRTVNLAAPGRYKKFRIEVPQPLRNLATELTEHASLVLDTGYQWICDQVLDVTRARERHAGSALYVAARAIFPEQQIRSELWFATLGPLYGFRLLDDDAVAGALETYTQLALTRPVNPLDWLSQLIESRLPRDLLLMDAAARSNSPIEVDISNAGYARAGMSYAYVMQGLYSGTSFTIYPLYRVGEIAVLALYPTGRDVIQQRLALHEEELRERARLIADKIAAAADLFDVEEESALLQAEATTLRPQNAAMALARAVDRLTTEEGGRGWRRRRLRKVNQPPTN